MLGPQEHSSNSLLLFLAHRQPPALPSTFPEWESNISPLSVCVCACVHTHTYANTQTLPRILIKRSEWSPSSPMTTPKGGSRTFFIPPVKKVGLRQQLALLQEMLFKNFSWPFSNIDVCLLVVSYHLTFKMCQFCCVFCLRTFDTVYNKFLPNEQLTYKLASSKYFF